MQGLGPRTGRKCRDTNCRWTTCKLFIQGTLLDWTFPAQGTFGICETRLSCCGAMCHWKAANIAFIERLQRCNVPAPRTFLGFKSFLITPADASQCLCSPSTQVMYDKNSMEPVQQLWGTTENRMECNCGLTSLRMLCYFVRPLLFLITSTYQDIWSCT